MCIRNQLLPLVVIIVITVLFKNMWTLKFKSQLTFAFYSAVNHLRKQNLTYRVFSLTWLASMQIYWNKRKRLHKKRVQFPEDWFGTPTWPPFHCFGTPIWPPWRHVKTLYKWVQQAMVCDLAVIGGFWYVWHVSVFQGSFLVIIIMIDGSENRFQLWSSRVCEKRSKVEWLWSLLYVSVTCFVFFLHIFLFSVHNF